MRFLLVKQQKPGPGENTAHWEPGSLCSVPHSPSHSLRLSFPSMKCDPAPAWSFLGPILQQTNVSLWRVRLRNPYFFKLPGDSDEQTGLEFAGLESVSSFFQFKNLMCLGIKFCRRLSRHWAGNIPNVLMLLGHWDMVLKT